MGELGPGTTGREKIEICSGFNVKISACLFLHLWQIDLRLPTNFFTVVEGGGDGARLNSLFSVCGKIAISRPIGCSSRMAGYGRARGCDTRLGGIALSLWRKT